MAASPIAACRHRAHRTWRSIWMGVSRSGGARRSASHREADLGVGDREPCAQRVSLGRDAGTGLDGGDGAAGRPGMGQAALDQGALHASAPELGKDAGAEQGGPRRCRRRPAHHRRARDSSCSAGARPQDALPRSFREAQRALSAPTRSSARLPKPPWGCYCLFPGTLHITSTAKKWREALARRNRNVSLVESRKGSRGQGSG